MAYTEHWYNKDINNRKRSIKNERKLFRYDAGNQEVLIWNGNIMSKLHEK